jgi:spermidine dehydrogenase
MNGVALGIGAGVFAPGHLWALDGTSRIPKSAAELGSAHYPPTLTGLRGSHEGSYEVAHALAWRGEKPTEYQTLDEHYDLAVVGAGMSGLAAAWYFRKKMGPQARILILDNHDDFGGHAKRNEFHHNGRMVLSLGGAQNLDSPGNYSEAAGSLMRDLGIDQSAIEAMDENTPDNYLLGGKWHGNLGLSMPGTDGHTTVGGHWYKFMHGRGEYAAAVQALPIPKVEQDKLIHFFGGKRDFLDDLSWTEQYDYINSVSYNRFLVDRVGLSKETVAIFDAHLLILNGPSGWQHTVLEAISAGAPGLRAMGWLTNFVDSLAALMIEDLAEIRMFPDGNASVARLLVQKLIPSVSPGMMGFEDVAVARFNYGELDQQNQATRIRLNSTVVGVREADDSVIVEYVRAGVPQSISASHCVLACYNNLIPHLCPEMSERQKEALQYGVRVPFVYANVLIDNGRAFSQLGVEITQCPYDAFQWVSAAPTMTSGGYQPPRGPEDPMAVFMMGSPTPAVEDGTGRNLYRVGRQRIYATTFEQYEVEVRQQLQSMLGKYGFNHETDIRAITVNRIPHGYAYFYHGLDDPEWEEGQAPHEIGRTQFGRISIANTDSEATPLMDAAFDAAWRSVEEQTA